MEYAAVDFAEYAAYDDCNCGGVRFAASLKSGRRHVFYTPAHLLLLLY